MDFMHARTTMVDNQIRTEDVTDWNILRAFLTVPRQDFVPEGQRELAYIGKELSLPGGRSLMAPSAIARLLQLLLIAPGDAVLTVGGGTGYGAAIMSSLSGKVVMLEENQDLASAARETLARHAGAHVTVAEGPLREGWAAGAPYDRIFFEGAIEELPEVFVEQLRDGGRMVAVEGRGNAASARLYLKEEGGLSNRFAFNCSVSMLPGFARAPQFVF